MVYWVYKRVYLRVYQCLPQYHQLLFPINIHENYIHIYMDVSSRNYIYIDINYNYTIPQILLPSRVNELTVCDIENDPVEMVDLPITLQSNFTQLLKITIFNGKAHYFYGPFSSSQTVSTFTLEAKSHLIPKKSPLLSHC